MTPPLIDPKVRAFALKLALRMKFTRLRKRRAEAQRLIEREFPNVEDQDAVAALVFALLDSAVGIDMTKKILIGAVVLLAGLLFAGFWWATQRSEKVENAFEADANGCRNAMLKSAEIVSQQGGSLEVELGKQLKANTKAGGTTTVIYENPGLSNCLTLCPMWAAAPRDEVRKDGLPTERERLFTRMLDCLGPPIANEPPKKADAVVAPPVVQPSEGTLTRAMFHSKTKRDNKDKDTGVFVYVYGKDNTLIAKVENADNSGTDATEYNNGSEHDLKLDVLGQPLRSACEPVTVTMKARANGDDTWELESAYVELFFTSGEPLKHERTEGFALKSTGGSTDSATF